MTSNDYGMPVWEAEFLNSHHNQFCAWLTEECGAVMVNKFSEYEVLRFRTHQGIQILYKKKNGLLTWTGYMEGLWLTYVHGEVIDLKPIIDNDTLAEHAYDMHQLLCELHGAYKAGSIFTTHASSRFFIDVEKYARMDK